MRTWVRSIGYCLTEARPVVIAIFLLRFLAGALLGSGGHRIPAGPLALGALGWGCATVAVYLYNGITDYREDVANASHRPIATGALPVRFAAAFSVATAVVAVTCNAVLGAAQLAAVVVFLVLGQVYSGWPLRLKRRFYAASLVGAAGGLATYTDGALCGGHRAAVPLIVFSVAMSLWMGLVGGIAKDLPDERGDREAGRRTWPVVFGARGARALMMGAAAFVGVGFGAAAAAWSAGLLWCALVVLLGAVAVIVTGPHPKGAYTRDQARHPYQAFMWTQHISHLVLVGTLGFAALAWR